MTNQPTDEQLRLVLKRAVGDARILAFVFVVTGMFGFWLAMGVMRQTEGQLFGGGCAVILLAPGVLYFVAGQQIKARQSAGGKLGLWAAACHIAGIPLTFAAAFAMPDRSLRVFAVPAGVSIFFVPALIAFLFSMRKARRIARLLGEPGQGFAVLPTQAVLPIEPGADDALKLEER